MIRDVRDQKIESCWDRDRDRDQQNKLYRDQTGTRIWRQKVFVNFSVIFSELCYKSHHLSIESIEIRVIKAFFKF